MTLPALISNLDLLALYLMARARAEAMNALV